MTTPTDFNMKRTVFSWKTAFIPLFRSFNFQSLGASKMSTLIWRLHRRVLPSSFLTYVLFLLAIRVVFKSKLKSNALISRRIGRVFAVRSVLLQQFIPSCAEVSSNGDVASTGCEVTISPFQFRLCETTLPLHLESRVFK